MIVLGIALAAIMGVFTGAAIVSVKNTLKIETLRFHIVDLNEEIDGLRTTLKEARKEADEWMKLAPDEEEEVIEDLREMCQELQAER